MSTCCPSYNIPAVTVSSVAFCSSLQKHVHDPQEEEAESGKEGLKSQEGLEPVVKDPVGELAKVSCSHAISATTFLLSLFCLLCCLFLFLVSRKSA